MNLKPKTTTIIAMALFLSLNLVASGSIFDWLGIPSPPAFSGHPEQGSQNPIISREITGPLATPTQENPLKSSPEGKFNDFVASLYQLNTPGAIQSLNEEMDSYGVKVVKIRVYKLPWQECEYCGRTFYVVKDRGVVADYPWGYDPSDKEIALTYSQIMEIYPLVQDGHLTLFEKWRIYSIYKFGWK